MFFCPQKNFVPQKKALSGVCNFSYKETNGGWKEGKERGVRWMYVVQHVTLDFSVNNLSPRKS